MAKPSTVKSKASEVSSLTSRVSTVATEYFECDYELDCTPLYKAIENAIVQEEEDYDHIAEFLETGKWPHEHSASTAAPSAETQAKTWVTRFNPKDKKQVEWSQLPIHLAIVGGAPSNIIGGLVKLYPQALRCTDDQRMLPLHLALRHGADDEIVAYLLMQFPEAVNAMGKHDRTPVECALRSRDKLRGIILECFVEKTKSKLQKDFMEETTALSASLDEKTVQLEKVTAELKVKNEALKLLQSEHSTQATELDELKIAKTKMEEELMNQVKELTKEKAEQETTAQQKIEKLTSEKLTESIELQKKIDALVAEKAAADDAERKAKEEQAVTRKELESVQKTIASTVTQDDWVALKKEVDSLQSYRLTRTKSQAKDNIDLLKGEIEKTLSETKSEAKDLKSELKSLQKTVSKLEKSESAVKTSDDVAKLQSEVETLRAELRERNAASKMKLELAVLKKAMEVELKKHEGKSADQLAAIAGAVAKVNPTELESKMNTELKALKTELELLSLELKENELARKTAADVEELERALNMAMKEADSKNKGELASMKPAVENLRKYIANSKSKKDLIGAAKDVEALKDLLRKTQVTSTIESEANILKASIDAELQKSKAKEQEKELLRMKETITSLMSASLASNDADEQEKIRNELKAVKVQLKEVEEATKTQAELVILKKTVEEELHRATQKTEKDLSEMKRAVDAVNLEQVESKSLKESLATEIKRANGKTEKELLELKQKVEAINISDLQSKNKNQWEIIRKDLEVLKVDLKNKQEAKLDDTEKELKAVKEAISQINEEQDKKTDIKFEALRKEMNSLRDDLTPTSPSPKKKGLKKYFLMKFLRPSSMKASDVEYAANRSKVSSKNDIPTILPPSLTIRDNEDKNAASSDDEEGVPPGVQRVQSMEKNLAKADTKEREVTLALHKSMSMGSEDGNRSLKVDAATVKALPSFSPKTSKLLPSALRKVKSLDPRLKNVTIDPHEIVRTWSKTVMQSSGEVELETVEECDSRSELTSNRA